MDNKCDMIGCGGELDMTDGILLQTGCESLSRAYPCKKCGRLHFRSNGGACFNRQGYPRYLSGLRNVVHFQVWKFTDAESMQKRDRAHPVFAGEAASKADLETVQGAFLLCRNGTGQWIGPKKAMKLLPN